MTARPLRIIERHPVTSLLVLGLVGFIVLGLFLNRVANDAAQRADREQNARITDVEQLQQALEDETKARTAASCAETARTRDGTIKAWAKILDVITPKEPDGTPKPSMVIDNLRAIVADAYPPVTCPTDQGPIVIPQPSTTAAPS